MTWRVEATTSDGPAPMEWFNQEAREALRMQHADKADAQFDVQWLEGRKGRWGLDHVSFTAVEITGTLSPHKCTDKS